MTAKDHGSESTYVNHKCRCDECRAAHAAYGRRRKAERRELIGAKMPKSTRTFITPASIVAELVRRMTVGGAEVPDVFRKDEHAGCPWCEVGD